MSESGSNSESVPDNCSWYIDGLAAIRSLRPTKTYREWLKRLLQFVTPPKECNAVEVGLINDTYKKDSVKEGTRLERGASGKKVTISGFDQNMLQGNNWQEFLNSGENKEELIQLIAKYLQTDEGKSLLQQPLVVTAAETTYSLCDGVFSILYKCNHEEADTRLVLHASQASGDVVVVSKDTDVLILMVWAYQKLRITKTWYLKYDHNKYANIGAICSFLGENLCLALPAIHGLTGCDTTSYLFKVGKVKVMKKLLNSPNSVHLLDGLGKDVVISVETQENVKEFIRTVLYAGREKETYIQTRVRLYKEMNVKSSMSLPPDPDSVTQVIKRAHYQTYIWLRCTEINIEMIPFSNYGWQWCNKQGIAVPVWFTGSQLPPSLRTKRRNDGRKRNDRCDGGHASEDADVESETETPTRRRKKQRTKSPVKSTSRSTTRNLHHQLASDTSTSQRDFDEESLLTEDEDNDPIFGNRSEDEWEVSDFFTSEDSGDEWFP